MESNFNGLELAVIGISGRFPKSASIEQFWQNLVEGNELISPFSDSSFLSSKSNQGSQGFGAILEDVDQFDASFFSLNPREAELMDPQHRLFLECAWEALENAGYDSEQETRPIGIYAGVGISTYFLYNLQPNQEKLQAISPLQTMLGVDKDYLPTRASYKLNLKGPSVSVQTACSSSLVAVHLACQSLLSGECDLVLAAGISVKVPQNELTLAPGEIIASDGHCRAFDANAEGTLGGNGIGVVVLKRLEDAIADRDHIYAVIKGSATNNDGDVKVGYTAPSEEGQAKVIHAAQVAGDVDPSTVTYMEAHGTGTPLGDPIEVAAMTRAFRASTQGKQYCALGSVKTNAGHLDAAAGITGFIKTVLALHHKVIPPSLNFETPNPEIDFVNSPFYVNTQASPWVATDNGPRRAGVSSFGFGGTNAHVVLEEAPPLPVVHSSLSPQLLVLSAKSPTALVTAQTNLAQYFKQYPNSNLADVAYTLQIGRRAFPHRNMAIVETVEQAIQCLELGNLHRRSPDNINTSNPPVVFMFTGQGAQFVNMARQLYETEPVFRDALDRCNEILQPYLEQSLLHILYPDEGEQCPPYPEFQVQADQFQTPNSVPVASPVEKFRIHQTAYAQPALFSIEYALAQLWISWGIRPAAMIGHSIGEYVAACLAEVFSLEDALQLVVQRGQLMQSCQSGAMLAVSLPVDALHDHIKAIPPDPQTGMLELAVSNSPKSQVVSGSEAAIDRLEQHLSQQGILSRRLQTSHAFHSVMMEPVLEPFTEAVQRIQRHTPTIPFISNRTGTWITESEATDPAYWAQHLRQTVQFSQGVAELLNRPDYIFLEVGPGQTLTRLVKQQAPEPVVLNSLPHPLDDQSDRTCMLSALGQLWLVGVSVNWSNVSDHEPCHRLPLPTYPFERQRYWIDPPGVSDHKLDNSLVSDTNGANGQGNNARKLAQETDLENWFYVPSWKRSVPPLDQPSCFAHLPDRWLVFVDEIGLGGGVVQRLEEYGCEVIQVWVSNEFSQVSDRRYMLNPDQPQHYAKLMQAVCTQGSIPYIVHCWSLILDPDLEQAQSLGFYSLLYLAQAIGQQTLSDATTLHVISSQVYKVIGNEQLCPEKATLVGPCKVIPQEYPNLTCRLVDIVVSGEENHSESLLLRQVMAEIAEGVNLSEGKNQVENTVTYRGCHRWIPSLEPVSIQESSCQPCLQEQGIYLIIGGLGGIGLTIAHYLARTYQAKLILLGRSALPDKTEWQEWLNTHDEGDLVALKIKQLQALEALGAEVLVRQADVTDRVQMQQIADDITHQFGSINGVFHAAGILKDGIIQLKTPETVNLVMAPKVYGAKVLTQVFKEDNLDFIVLFSSISSIVGGVGQVDYCAANAFLDAVASSSDSKTLISSINWDAWKEVGMGANQELASDLAKQQHQALLETGISPQEGVKALIKVLDRGLQRVLISPRNRSIFTQSLTQLSQALGPSIANLQDFNDQTSTKLIPTHKRTLTTPYIAPRNPIEQQVSDLWKELIGIDKIGVEDNFFEIGGHSLLAVQIIARLRELYAVDLPLRTLLSETPTIAGMATAITQQLPELETLDEMNEILSQIENLSLDEVRTQLEANQGAIP